MRSRGLVFPTLTLRGPLGGGDRRPFSPVGHQAGRSWKALGALTPCTTCATVLW
jgi:hypothetical protein